MTTNEPLNPDQTPRAPDRTETARLPEHREFAGGSAAPGAAPGAAPAGPAAAGIAGAGAAVPPGGPGDGPGSEKTQKHRPWLIGAGIAVAVLLLGGGGIAIGASLADDDRDDASVSSSERGALEDRDDGSDGPSSGAEDGLEDGRESGTGSGSASGSGAELAPADAGSLADAIDAAVAEASGEGATSIEVERGGWGVDVRLADGTEVEVRVAEDGSATVRESDGDRDDDPLLETSQLPAIIDAALEAAGGGQIESISTDNDRVRYDVSVDLGNGQDVDVELDEDLGVIEVD